MPLRLWPDMTSILPPLRGGWHPKDDGWGVARSASNSVETNKGEGR